MSHTEAFLLLFGACLLAVGLAAWARRRFERGQCLICGAAVGRAVRMLVRHRHVEAAFCVQHLDHGYGWAEAVVAGEERAALIREALASAKAAPVVAGRWACGDTPAAHEPAPRP